MNMRSISLLVAIGVGSFARCEACHRGAEQGDFDEHGVRIPGHGNWDD